MASYPARGRERLPRMRVGILGFFSSGCTLVWALDPGVRHQWLAWVDLRQVGFVLIAVAVVLVIVQGSRRGWRTLVRFDSATGVAGGEDVVPTGDRAREREPAGRL